MAMHFNNVTIVGVGLIGGSLARVLKAKGLAGRITGAGRSRQTLELALRIGVIDQMGLGPRHAVGDADLVVLACPVGAFEPVIRELGPHLKKGAIVTDVGSVKGVIVKKMEELAPPDVYFIGGHPIAGKERSGVSEATETLFRGAKCILTPTSKTAEAALAVVREIWTEAGANVIVMDPDLHDKVFAAVSHLPHVAAYAMMCAVSELNTDDGNYVDFSGAGFRDFTRIAASSPEMWRDICLMNREHLLEMIERYQFSLNKFKKEIFSRNGKRLEGYFKQAQDARKGLDSAHG